MRYSSYISLCSALSGTDEADLTHFWDLKSWQERSFFLFLTVSPEQQTDIVDCLVDVMQLRWRMTHSSTLKVDGNGCVNTGLAVNENLSRLCFIFGSGSLLII